MRKILIVLLAGCVGLVVGCHLPGIRGNGRIKTEERPIATFANVDASGAFEIEWQNGPPIVRVTTDENLLPYVETNVSGDTLNVAITGAGKVTYSGNPATIKKQITGAGSIRHKD